MFENQFEIVLRSFLKEKELELLENQRNIGSLFHFLGTATWNARETMTVLHRGSTNSPIPEDHNVKR